MIRNLQDAGFRVQGFGSLKVVCLGGFRVWGSRVKFLKPSPHPKNLSSRCFIPGLPCIYESPNILDDGDQAGLGEVKGGAEIQV